MVAFEVDMGFADHCCTHLMISVGSLLGHRVMHKRIVRVLQASRLRGITLITLAGLARHMLLQRASRSASAAKRERNCQPR